MADAPDSRSTKIVAAVTTVLLIASVVWITGLLGRNARLADTVRTEKLSRETMLSEKLLLEKEIAKLHVEQSAQEEIVGELNHQQAVLSGRLRVKDEKIRALNRLYTPVGALRKQHHLLEKDRNELVQKVTDYQASLRDLQSEHSDAVRTIALLRDQNLGLAGQLRAAQMQSLNDVRIEAHTRRNGLTVRARNMRSLVVSATVANVVDKPAFRIMTPEGRILSAEDGSMVTRVIDNDVSLKFAGLQKGVLPQAAIRRRLEMVFTPKLRLAGGTYTVQVLNDDTVIGSLQTTLR
jgi:hypothetical protein